MRGGREKRNVPIKISSNKSPVWLERLARKIKLIDGGICAKVLILETGTASCGETRSHFLNTKGSQECFMALLLSFGQELMEHLIRQWSPTPLWFGLCSPLVQRVVRSCRSRPDWYGRLCATLVAVIIVKLTMAAQ